MVQQLPVHPASSHHTQQLSVQLNSSHHTQWLSVHPTLFLPKYSATPTGCVCCQRPSRMKCLIWWPLPLRFAEGLGNFLGYPSREGNVGCLLQHPPDGRHCPQVDTTRDVFMKQWQILTEIRPRPWFAFVDSSYASMPPTASGSDNIRQQTGAALTGTGV